MNIRYLRYFISVAEHLNFSKAAEHLYIGQPGLSQGIANLEKQLGFKLFERDRRSVKLTPAGLFFLEEANAIIDKFDKAVEKSRWVHANLLGDLNLGFLPSLGKVFLPQWICNFSKKHPQINLQPKEHTMATLHIALEHGELDIGYTRSFGLPTTSGYGVKKISTDTVSVVVRNDHPLANQKSIDLSDLSKESFVLLAKQEAPQWREFAMQIFANRGFSPNIIDTPNRPDGMYTLISAGLGVGIVPSSNRTSDIPEIKFINIEGKDACFKTILSWKTSNINPAIQIFLNTIEEV